MDANKKNERYLTLSFILTALVLSYIFTEFRFLLNREYSPSKLQSLVDNFTATPVQYLPFRYRVFTVYIVRLVYGWGRPFFTSSLDAFKLVEFAYVLLLLIAFRRYLLIFLKSKRLATVLTFTIFYPISFNFLLPHNITPWYYPWDISSILFFTLGLVFLHEKHWIAYYPLFTIATFNRETTLFLTCIYVFISLGKTKVGKVIFHALLQFIVWIAVKYLLYTSYAIAPGAEFFENHLLTNIFILTDFRIYPLLLSNMGFILVFVILLYALIPDESLKRTLLVVFPFSILMLFVGVFYELRIYGELIPPVLVSFLLVLKESFKSGSALFYVVILLLLASSGLCLLSSSLGERDFIYKDLALSAFFNGEEKVRLFRLQKSMGDNSLLLTVPSVTITKNGVVQECNFSDYRLASECYSESWEQIMVLDMVSGGENRVCLFVHPRDNTNITLRFLNVRLSKNLAFMTAIRDDMVSGYESDVYLDIYINDVLVTRVVQHDIAGWVRTPVDTTAFYNKKSDIKLVVHTDKDIKRNFCLNAYIEK